MNIKKHLLKVSLLSSGLLLMAAIAMASDIGSPNIELIKGFYPGKTYSLYAQREFPNNIYWV